MRQAQSYGRRAVFAALVAGALCAGALCGCTPERSLFQCIEERDAKAVDALLGKGTDPNMVDKADRPALIAGTESGAVRIVKSLLRAGADVNASDRQGQTALMIEARSRYPSLARQLLAAGADVNRKNAAGDTALMIASAEGNWQTMLLFLKTGADITTKNTSGEDAATAAERTGHAREAHLLRALRGDLPPDHLTPQEALGFWALQARGRGLIDDFVFANISDGVVSVFDYDDTDAIYLYVKGVSRYVTHGDPERLVDLAKSLRDTIERVYTTQSLTQKTLEYAKDHELHTTSNRTGD